MVGGMICVDEKEWVLVRSVEGVLGNERLGFEEVFPLLTDTLEFENGFGGKPCENVGDYVKGKEGVFHCSCHIGKEEMKEVRL